LDGASGFEERREGKTAKGSNRFIRLQTNLEDQGLTALALHLPQVCLVYKDAIMVQRVLKRARLGAMPAAE
jgi:hypothetical protein